MYCIIIMNETYYKNKYIKYKSKYLKLKQVGRGKRVIAISGISGAGKSTLGKLIADRLNGIYIDQDWFFKKSKPQVTLSDGSITSNWDTPEAIDLEAMNQKIKYEISKHNIVVVGGFALWDKFFNDNTRPDVHFHIKIPKNLSLETRLKVKNLSAK